MVLVKRLSREKILEILAALAQEDIPKGIEGDLHVNYDDDDGVEIFFIEKSAQQVS